MKKVVYSLLGIITVFVLTQGNLHSPKDSQQALSYDKVVQYTEGHVGG
ncbi:hypothetical protein [Bacillus thuringiensis]